ncbi:MAG: TRAP transporter small permease subunit [Syntrophorhabdaceae bacterium]|nr:TRAP transporter small permease subunit [Syntrophorhabdaceae bacterium]
MRVFWMIFDKLLNILAGLAGVILVFICIAVCYTIGMRYLFSKTTIWVMQTTEYALLWMLFFGTGWLLREKGHITTDIIHSHLSEPVRKWVDTIMFIASGIACGIMCYYGIKHVHECIVNNITDVRAVTIPKWTIFWVVPFGSGLLMIQFFRMAWHRIIDDRKGR